jgi:hypothetical protein
MSYLQYDGKYIVNDLGQLVNFTWADNVGATGNYPKDKLLARWNLDSSLGDMYGTTNINGPLPGGSYPMAASGTVSYVNGKIGKGKAVYCNPGVIYTPFPVNVSTNSGSIGDVFAYGSPDVGAGAATPKGWTVSLWGKIAVAQDNTLMLFEESFLPGNNTRQWVEVKTNSNNKVTLELVWLQDNVEIKAFRSDTSTYLTTGAWNHFIVSGTLNTNGTVNTLSLYINNQLIVSDNSSSVNMAFGVPLYQRFSLGGRVGTTNWGYGTETSSRCYFDNCYIYYKVLDQVERDKLYNRGYGI